ncbi:MAG: toll/interleukin-1 receptor domain-containing protein [Roseiarcus sp.]
MFPARACGGLGGGMGEKFFVSYTSSDREWAQWIGAELRTLGHEPFVHEWEIGAGEDIYAWMEKRHDQADHVISVVSDAYMKAPFSMLECNAALWRSAKLGQNFALLALVEPIKLPNLVDFMRRYELFGVSKDEAQKRFHEFIAERKALDTVMFPGRPRAPSNVPIAVPQFFPGREEALQAVDAALKRYEGRVAISFGRTRDPRARVHEGHLACWALAET